MFIELYRKEPVKMEGFESSEVWQISRQIVHNIYKLTNKFPKKETYNLISQMRRAALSMPSNIAEGFGRYHYLTRIVFFYNARGSLFELKSHLMIAKDLSYIDVTTYNQTFQELSKLGVKLNNLINKTYSLSKNSSRKKFL